MEANFQNAGWFSNNICMVNNIFVLYIIHVLTYLPSKVSQIFKKYPYSVENKYYQRNYIYLSSGVYSIIDSFTSNALFFTSYQIFKFNDT